MTTETKILTNGQIDEALESIGPDWWDVSPGADRLYARAIEQTVLQSAEEQALRDLLKEARQQLPFAAQFWNEDDEPERGKRNLAHVMELIAKIDAAMEKQP